MELADAGTPRPTRLDAINRGWITITRPWHLATTNTGHGDPAGASAAKGQRLMEALSERLAGFLVELAKAPTNDEFPY